VILLYGKQRTLKAFIVYHNGKKLCTAGIGPHGVLSAIVNWVGGIRRRNRKAEASHTKEGHLFMHLGGLDTQVDEHVDWEVPEIKVGDKITIKIVETNIVDDPISRKKSQRPTPGGKAKRQKKK